jgi:hypothetical protein
MAERMLLKSARCPRPGADGFDFLALNQALFHLGLLGQVAQYGDSRRASLIINQTQAHLERKLRAVLAHSRVR